VVVKPIGPARTVALHNAPSHVAVIACQVPIAALALSKRVHRVKPQTIARMPAVTASCSIMPGVEPATDLVSVKHYIAADALLVLVSHPDVTVKSVLRCFKVVVMHQQAFFALS
jgi:hypothetical protein